MRTTVTLHDSVFRALRRRAVDSDSTVSQVIEDAVKQQVLEDLEDIEDARKRQAEPSLAFDDLVAEFQAEGLL